MKYCFGIDIGGTTVKIGLASEAGEILSRWEVPTRKGSDPSGLLEDVKKSLETCMAENKITKEEILGIGMAAPGPVTEDGVLHGCVNIGWGDVDLKAQAEKIIGISPVFIGNDARVAALGGSGFWCRKWRRKHVDGDAGYRRWRRCGSEWKDPDGYKWRFR